MLPRLCPAVRCAACTAPKAVDATCLLYIAQGRAHRQVFDNFMIAKKLADFSGLYPRRELSAAIALFQSMDMIFWLPQAQAALVQVE